MNHNRKRREAEAREQRRREAALKNAVLVDRAALDPSHCGLGTPDFLERGYYLDVPFTCASCGSDEVWTAAQQKWWYEVAKGSLYSGAKLCRTCRRDARLNKGKAHPLQNPGRWLGLIRDALESDLRAAGWRIVNGGDGPRPDLLGYARGDELARIRWDCGGMLIALVLERRAAQDDPFTTLARGEVSTYNMTPGELQRRFDDFLNAARREPGLN